MKHITNVARMKSPLTDWNLLVFEPDRGQVEDYIVTALLHEPTGIFAMQTLHHEDDRAALLVI